MGYDRVRIKHTAKAILRQARPRPWLVTLVYLLLASALPSGVIFAIFWPVFTLSAATSAIGPAGAIDAWSRPQFGGLSLALMLFLYVLTILFISLMQMGYQHYSMKLWRGEQTDFKDLFRGFSMAPRALALLGLIFLFTCLWSIPAVFVMVLITGIAAAASDSLFLAILPLLFQIGLMAYLYNRTLRYALSFYVLLDHPEYTALQALNESKVLMVGRRWELFVFFLSFIGWSLLVALIIYAVLFIGILIMVFLLAFSYESQNPFLGLSSILIPILLMGVGCLASAPLALWLQAYMGTATAGYYDWVAYPAPPTEPAWQPQPPGPAAGFYTSPAPTVHTPPPPQPPVDNGPAGTFYRGFITPAAPPPEEVQPEEVQPEAAPVEPESAAPTAVFPPEEPATPPEEPAAPPEESAPPEEPKP